MAQFNPRPAFDKELVDQAIMWLQTRDDGIFSFTAEFDDDRERAFAHDLQVALTDLSESGSKRGTAAVGFPISDRRLRLVIEAWATAGGDWPTGSDPDDLTSLLYTLTEP